MTTHMEKAEFLMVAAAYHNSFKEGRRMVFLDRTRAPEQERGRISQPWRFP